MRFRRFSTLPDAPFDRLNFDLAAEVYVNPSLFVRTQTREFMLCAEDRVPIKNTHLKCADPKRVLPIPGTTVSALRRHALANSFKTSNAVVVVWWQWLADVKATQFLASDRMIVALAVGTPAPSKRQTGYGIAQVLNAALGSCCLACVRSGRNTYAIQ